MTEPNLRDDPPAGPEDPVFILAIFGRAVPPAVFTPMGSGYLLFAGEPCSQPVRALIN